VGILEERSRGGKMWPPTVLVLSRARRGVKVIKSQMLLRRRRPNQGMRVPEPDLRNHVEGGSVRASLS